MRGFRSRKMAGRGEGNWLMFLEKRRAREREKRGGVMGVCRIALKLGR